MQISSIFSSFRFPGKVVGHELQPSLFLDLPLGNLSFFIGASQTNTDRYKWWIPPSPLELSLPVLPLDDLPDPIPPLPLRGSGSDLPKDAP